MTVKLTRVALWNAAQIRALLRKEQIVLASSPTWGAFAVAKVRTARRAGSVGVEVLPLSYRVSKGQWLAPDEVWAYERSETTSDTETGAQ